MFKKFTFLEVNSTNDVAKTLLEDENAVMVTSDYQTKGKGRNGKTWVGDTGKNIYVSFGFKNDKGESGEEITKYQMQGSLAVLKTLEETAPEVHFTLKYPNDVLAEHESLKGKISGILCEHEFLGMLCFKTVIGIGINVGQEKFEQVENNNPVSLKMLNIEATREEILKKLEREILVLKNVPREKIFKTWAEKLQILERKIEVKGAEGVWLVREILRDGRLKVFKNGENRIIDNGDSIRYL